MTQQTLIQAAAALRLAAQTPSVLWLDARFELGQPIQGRVDFAQAHLSGAQHIDLEQDLSSPAGSGGRHPLPERRSLAARLAQLGLHRQQVLIYDQGDMMYAARAWAMLRWLGHANVAVVDGGLPALKLAGAPMANDCPPVNAGTFVASAPLLPLRDAAIIEAGLGQDTAPLLVDARAGNRFAGTAHPLDPQCGHIPGARNRFFKHNLHQNGRFLPADVLRAQWLALLDGIRPEQVVHYCGSGVSACVNVLAMEYAGLHGSALYVGSWSEWAADAGKPIASGAA